MNYTAIVIAAGLSSRMREFKPLLDIGGKPALLLLLDTIRSAGIENIVVVTGYEKERVETVVDNYQTKGDVPCVFKTKGDVPCVLKDCLIIYNADYESGMFSSVRTGINAALGAQASLLFPADVPLVSSETIRGLVAAYEKGSPSRFAVPVYEGRNGHPLLIPQKYYDEILDYSGEGGLKGVRSRYDAEMLRYPVNDIGCVLDMDTPDDYERILEYIK